MRSLISFIVTFLVSLVSLSASEPLSEERLQSIVAEPHSAHLDEDALKVYPAAREYKITVTNTLPDGQSFSGEIVATEKWVDGRFIVSQAQPGGPESGFAMIVEYDKESKSYRKYLITAGGMIGFQVGTRVGESRTIAWIDLTSGKFESGMSGSDSLTTETHTDDTTTWSALFFEKGVLRRTETGVAKVTKR